MRLLRRRIVSFLAMLATALALMTAAAAVPARAAENDDLARALAAIGVIALIADSLGEGDRRDDPRRPDDRYGRDRDGRNRDDRGWDDRGWDDRGWDDRGWDDRHALRRGELPARCAVDLRNRRAGVVYAEPCLRDEGVRGRLPYACSRDVRVRGRYVTVFPQRCLVEAGYSPPRRRR